MNYTKTDSAGNTATITRDVQVVDALSPVLTLIGENPSHHELGTTYTDPGLTVTDSNGDPIENPDFTINGTDALSQVGSYALTYTYTDPDGHEAIPISRQVNVSDTTAPIVTLTGEPTVTLFLGQPFEDLGATALDSVDGDLDTVIRLHPPVGGLAAHWPFEAIDDQLSTPDATGQHPATIAGTDASALTPGILGKALYFDGIDDWVNADPWKGVTGRNARTLSAWIRTSKQNAAILNWGQNAQGKKWTFRTQTNNGIPDTIRVEINGGYASGSTKITDNQWHHVAAVIEQGAKANQIQFYVDGQRENLSANQNRGSTQDRTSR